MATQATIIEKENEILNAIDTLKSIREYSDYEKEVMGGKPENRNCWATLSINLAQLIREAKLTLKSVVNHTGGSGFYQADLKKLLD